METNQQIYDRIKKRNALRKQIAAFGLKSNPPKTSFFDGAGSLASDAANEAAIGTLNLGRAVADIAGASNVSKSLQNVVEGRVAALSPEQQAADQNDVFPDKKNGIFGIGLGKTPARSLFGVVTQSSPSILAGIATGGLATAAIRGTIAAAGRKRLVSSIAKSAAKGNPKAATKAVNLLSKSDMATGAAGFRIGEGAVAGASNRLSVKDQVLAMTPEQLSQSPEYNNNLNSGMTPDQARVSLADKVASQTFYTTAATTALFGGAPGRAFGKMFGAAKIPASRAGHIIEGLLAESKQELLQGAAEQPLMNLALQRADPSQSISEGIVNNALTGAVAGGILGGAVGSIAPVHSPETKKVADNVDGAPKSATDIEKERIATEKESKDMVRGLSSEEIDSQIKTTSALMKDAKDNGNQTHEFQIQLDALYAEQERKPTIQGQTDDKADDIAKVVADVVDSAPLDGTIGANGGINDFLGAESTAPDATEKQKIKAPDKPAIDYVKNKDGEIVSYGSEKRAGSFAKDGQKVTQHPDNPDRFALKNAEKATPVGKPAKKKELPAFKPEARPVGTTHNAAYDLIDNVNKDISAGNTPTDATLKAFADAKDIVSGDKSPAKVPPPKVQSTDNPFLNAEDISVVRSQAKKGVKKAQEALPILEARMKGKRKLGDKAPVVADNSINEQPSIPIKTEQEKVSVSKAGELNQKDVNPPNTAGNASLAPEATQVNGVNTGEAGKNEPSNTIPMDEVQAKKQLNGKFKLFKKGTNNEIYKGKVFTSVKEARAFHKEAIAVKVEMQNPTATSETVAKQPEKQVQAPENTTVISKTEVKVAEKGNQEQGAVSTNTPVGLVSQYKSAKDFRKAYQKASFQPDTVDVSGGIGIPNHVKREKSFIETEGSKLVEPNTAKALMAKDGFITTVTEGRGKNKKERMVNANEFRKLNPEYKDKTDAELESIISDYSNKAPAAIDKAFSDYYNKHSKAEPKAEKGNQGTVKKEVLSDLNPAGTVFAGYTPKKRASMALGENITTLNETSNKPADTMVTIYRGAPKNQKVIMAGDFITTNKQLAKDYAGTGHVLESSVRMDYVLDDRSDPLGEEYIYKPKELDQAHIPEAGKKVAAKPNKKAKRNKASIKNNGHVDNPHLPEYTVKNGNTYELSRSKNLQDANGIASSGVGEQGSAHGDVRSTNGLPRKARLVKTGRISTGIKEAHNLDDIAHITASLRKNAQENLVAVVMDKDGKVITMIAHSIGTKSSSLVDISSLAGAISSISGAKSVALSHNHPSGSAFLSDQDKAISEKFMRILNPLKINVMGIVAVTPNGDFGTNTSSHKGISPIKRDKVIPVSERKFIGTGNGEPLDSANDLKAAVEKLNPDSETGVIISNNRSRAMLFIKMSMGEMKSLRSNDAKAGKSLMSAIHEGNGIRIFPVVRGESSSALDNLGRFANAIDITMPDAFNLDIKSSLRENDKLPYPPASDVFLSKGSFQGNSESDKVRTAVSEIVGNAVTSRVVTSLPEGQQGRLLVADKIIEVASNIDDPVQVAWHEAFHALQKYVFNNQQIDVMNRAFDKGKTLRRQIEKLMRDNGLGEIVDNNDFNNLEAQAYAFQAYKAEKFEPKGLIARLFAKLRDIVEKVQNLIKGNGFTSAQSIFKSASKGEFATGRKSAIEITDNLFDKQRAFNHGNVKSIISEYKKKSGYKVKPTSPKAVNESKLDREVKSILGTEETGGVETASFERAVIPTDALVTLFDEHGKDFEGVYSDLSKDMADNGFNFDRPIDVFVDQNGFATINDGNHRVHAAATAGITQMVAKVHYFNRGETATGRFSPDTLGMDGATPFDVMLNQGTFDDDIFKELRSAEAKIGVPDKPTWKDRFTAAFSARSKLMAKVKLVDRYAALLNYEMEKFLKENPDKGRRDFPEHDSEAYMAFRIAAHADKAASAMISGGKDKNGVQFEWAKDETGARYLKLIEGKYGLFGILSQAGKTEDDVKSFVMWMAGTRAKRLATEDKEHRFTDEEINAMIKSGESHENFAMFKTMNEQLQEFDRNKLLVLVGAGSITEAEMESLLKDGDYISFAQIEEDLLKSNKKNEGVKFDSGISAIKGGKLNVDDLLKNMQTNVVSLMHKAMQADALRAMDDMFIVGHEVDRGLVMKAYEEGKSVAGTFRRGNKIVVTDISAVPKEFNKKPIYDSEHYDRAVPLLKRQRAIANEDALKAARRSGMDNIADADGMVDVMSVFYPEDGRTVSFIKNGKRVFRTVKDELFMQAITGLNRRVVNPYVDALLGKPKRFLTALITASPSFAMANGMRDYLNVKATTDAKTGLAGPIKGFMSGLSKDDEFMTSMINGGLPTAGHRTDLTTDGVRRMLKDLQDERFGKFTAGHIPKKISQWYFEDIIGNSENASRMAAYTALRKDGMGVRRASFISLDTMDFGLTGSSEIMLFLNGTVPFFNARVQGLYRLTRGFETHRRAVILYGGMIAAASIALALINADDERYTSLSEYEKDNYWIAFVGGQKIRGPKPFEIGLLFATMPERVIELFHDGLSEANLKRFWGRVKSGVENTLALSPIPQTIKILGEVALNTNQYTGKSIVPVSRTHALNEYQSTPHSSTVSKFIAKGTNSLFPNMAVLKPIESPADIDHIIFGMSGDIGRVSVRMLDAIIEGALNIPEGSKSLNQKLLFIGRFISDEDNIKGNKYTDKLFEMNRTIQEVDATISALKKDKNQAELLSFRKDHVEQIRASYRIKNAVKILRNIDRQKAFIASSTDPNKNEKARKLDARKAEIAKHQYELRSLF